MSMTVSAVKTLAQSLMDGGSDYSATLWLSLINAANQSVYRNIVTSNPDYFTVTAYVTVTGGAESIDLSGSGALNTIPYKLLSVERMPTSAALSSTNLPIPLLPCSLSERPSILASSGAPLSVDALTGATGLYPTHYTIQGSATLYLAPISTADVYLRVSYVPPLATLTTDNDLVLGGRCPEHADAVGYALASLCNARRENANPLAFQLWGDAKQSINDGAGSRSIPEHDHIRRVRR